MIVRYSNSIGNIRKLMTFLIISNKINFKLFFFFVGTFTTSILGLSCVYSYEIENKLGTYMLS